MKDPEKLTNEDLNRIVGGIEFEGETWEFVENSYYNQIYKNSKGEYVLDSYFSKNDSNRSKQKDYKKYSNLTKIKHASYI